MTWVVTSLVLSIVLTVVLNLVLRGRSVRPGGTSVDSIVRRADGRAPRRTRVFFPWKVMLAVSILATVVVNVIGR